MGPTHHKICSPSGLANDLCTAIKDECCCWQLGCQFSSREGTGCGRKNVVAGGTRWIVRHKHFVVCWSHFRCQKKFHAELNRLFRQMGQQKVCVGYQILSAIWRRKTVFHLGCKYCKKLAIAFGLINKFVDTSLYRKWSFASVGCAFDFVRKQFGGFMIISESENSQFQTLNTRYDIWKKPGKGQPVKRWGLIFIIKRDVQGKACSNRSLLICGLNPWGHKSSKNMGGLWGAKPSQV